jgi:hypothetical protein
VQQLCSCAVGTQITPQEAVQAARQRLVPELEYILKTTSLDKKQCKEYTTALIQMFAATLGLNQNYPGAVLRVHEKYGGMEFPNVECPQNQTKLEYWLKQLAWDKTVSNNFKVVLALVQLSSGPVTPIFLTPDDQ